MLASASADGFVRVWSPSITEPSCLVTLGADETGTTPFLHRKSLVRALNGKGPWIKAAPVFSPDGNFLAVTGSWFSHSFWDQSGEGFFFTLFGSILLTGVAGAVDVFSTRGWSREFRLAAPEASTAAVVSSAAVWSPCGRFLAALLLPIATSASAAEGDGMEQGSSVSLVRWHTTAGDARPRIHCRRFGLACGSAV